MNQLSNFSSLPLNFAFFSNTRLDEKIRKLYEVQAWVSGAIAHILFSAVPKNLKGKSQHLHHR
ncbi:hypothetical protein [Nostoc sp.]|uniref:hypothetical protein n=1 Tax=Nostoc sp. TaxID=1180 RepID=UPI002FF4D866